MLPVEGRRYGPQVSLVVAHGDRLGDHVRFQLLQAQVDDVEVAAGPQFALRGVRLVHVGDGLLDLVVGGQRVVLRLDLLALLPQLHDRLDVMFGDLRGGGPQRLGTFIFLHAFFQDHDAIAQFVYGIHDAVVEFDGLGIVQLDLQIVPLLKALIDELLFLVDDFIGLRGLLLGVEDLLAERVELVEFLGQGHLVGQNEVLPRLLRALCFPAIRLPASPRSLFSPRLLASRPQARRSPCRRPEPRERPRTMRVVDAS